MTVDQLFEALKTIAPAMAVYVAIRIDIAELKVKTQRNGEDIQALFKIKG